MTTTAHTPVRAVAGSVAGISVLLLLVAAWFAVDTWVAVSAPGDSGLAGLGFLVAGLVAAVALPALLLAVVALRTSGAVAVASAILSVIVLVAAAVFAVSWL